MDRWNLQKDSSLDRSISYDWNESREEWNTIDPSLKIIIRKRYLYSKLIKKTWIVEIFKRTTFLLDHDPKIKINRKKNETKHHSLKNKSEVYSNSYSKAISSKLISKTWIVEIYKKTRLLIDQYPIIKIHRKKNETR